MPGPNNINNLAKTWKEITPVAKDFEDSVFPSDEVRMDEEVLAEYKSKETQAHNNERDKSKKLEITCAMSMEREDWFSEGERFSDDTSLEFESMAVFPTSEIDDYFNHADAVVGIKNKDTGYKPVPFAIDMTLDESKLGGKMSWRHVWGKMDFCPADESEFGHVVPKDGKMVVRPQPLTRRHGMNIPGFTAVKYFEDKNSGLAPMFEKGRITLMPRFVVGFGAGTVTGAKSDDLIELLAWEGLSDDYPENLREQYAEKYDMAVRKAKWCTLLELRQQALDIRHYLSKMSAEAREKLDPDELAMATEQINMLCTYFKHAVEVADKRAAQRNADGKAETIAKRYAERKDKMVNSIFTSSHSIYIDRIQL